MKKIISSLLLGVLLGVAATQLYSRRHPRMMDPDTRFKYVVEKFNKRLHLSPEQKTQVEAILKTKREKIDALRAESKPKFEAIRQETRQEISKILNPDQIKKFEELDEEMSRRWHKRHP